MEHEIKLLIYFEIFVHICKVWLIFIHYCQHTVVPEVKWFIDVAIVDMYPVHF